MLPLCPPVVAVPRSYRWPPLSRASSPSGRLLRLWRAGALPLARLRPQLHPLAPSARSPVPALAPFGPLTARAQHPALLHSPQAYIAARSQKLAAKLRDKVEEVENLVVERTPELE